MAKRPVRWYDGLFLRPQHFQALHEHLQERIDQSENWFHPYHWGLRRLQFDLDALKNFRFVLQECELRLRDGTIVRIPEETNVAALDLREAFATNRELVIYLSVPMLQPGKQGVAKDGDAAAEGARYRPFPEAKYDLESGEEKEIGLLSLRTKLSAGAANLEVAGFEQLPIARLRLTPTVNEAIPELDPGYIPPLLCVDAWPQLRNEIRSFVELLRTVVDQEADFMTGRNLTLENQARDELTRILKLMACNSAIVPFEAALPLSSSHPHPIYLELSRLAGQLGLFESNRKTPPVAPYDHDRLGDVFPPLLALLRGMLSREQRRPWEKKYFKKEGPVFRVSVEPDWLQSTLLFVGIETADLTIEECDTLMSGHCDWKLASADQVLRVMDNHEEGLHLSRVDRPPVVLPPRIAYYKFERRQDYWSDVLRTNALGLCFRLEPGREGFVKEQPENVVLLSPRTSAQIVLKFAVYIVRNQ